VGYDKTAALLFIFLAKRLSLYYPRRFGRYIKMSAFALSKNDLRVSRSTARVGGAHLFEGLTRSHNVLEKSILMKGSPTTAHVFGTSSAVKNNLYKRNRKLRLDGDDAASVTSTASTDSVVLEAGEKKFLVLALKRARHREKGEPVPLAEDAAIRDIILQYEHQACSALHDRDYSAAIHLGKEIMRLVSRIYGGLNSLSIYAGVILGEANFLLGKLAIAKRYLLAAERRLEHVNNNRSAQVVRSAIACYTKLGDVFFFEAEQAHKAKNIDMETRHVDLACDAYKHAAHLLDGSGGDSTYCHTRMGSLQQEIGQYVSATKAFENALSAAAHFARAPTDMNFLLAHKQLADCLLLRDRFGAALEHYIVVFDIVDNTSKTIGSYCKTESEVTCVQTRSQLAISIATCLRAVGQVTQAIDMIEDAAVIVKSKLLKINVEGSAPPTQPINVFKEAEQMELDNSRLKSTKIYIQCLESLGHTNIALGNLVVAEQNYEAAMGVLDGLTDDEMVMERRGILYTFLGDVKVHEYVKFTSPHETSLSSNVSEGTGLNDSTKVEEGESHLVESAMEKSLPLRASELSSSNPPKGQDPPASHPCLQDALLNYKCALDIAQSIGGAESPQTIKIAARVGQLWALLGEYSCALREFQYCLALAKRLDPKYASLLGSLCIAVANILSKGSDIQQERAMTLYSNSVTIISRMFGADSPTIAAAYTGIGQLWLTRDQPASALRHLLHAEGLARSNFGDADRLRLYLLQNVAIGYLALGKPSKTLETISKLEQTYTGARKSGNRSSRNGAGKGVASTAKLLWNATSLLYSWSSQQPRKSVLKDLKAKALRDLAQSRVVNKSARNPAKDGGHRNGPPQPPSRKTTANSVRTRALATSKTGIQVTRGGWM
jgi:tetratricopeptide (TPR) repeat protein